MNMKKQEKLKPGQIRITPSDNRLLEMPPYKNSVENHRPWFKILRKGEGSLRRCAGINDFFNIGVTLPSWTNFKFRPDGNGDWETRGDEFGYEINNIKIASMQGFPYESTGECPVTGVRPQSVKEAAFPKLVNPWKIETAPGWSCLMLPAYWEPNNNYSIMAAVVHTDFYHTANVVLNITSEKEFTIKYGTPLLHIIPFERKTNIDKLILADESNYKYVANKGFGFGHVMPAEGTAAPYRRERIRVDKELDNIALSKKSIISRLLPSRGSTDGTK